MRWMDIILKHQDEKQLENNVVMMGLNIKDDIERPDQEDITTDANVSRHVEPAEKEPTSSFDKYIKTTT